MSFSFILVLASNENGLRDLNSAKGPKCRGFLLDTQEVNSAEYRSCSASKVYKAQLDYHGVIIRR